MRSPDPQGSEPPHPLTQVDVCHFLFIHSPTLSSKKRKSVAGGEGRKEKEEAGGTASIKTTTHHGGVVGTKIASPPHACDNSVSVIAKLMFQINCEIAIGLKANDFQISQSMLLISLTFPLLLGL